MHLTCMRCFLWPPTHHSSVSINANTNPTYYCPMSSGHYLQFIDFSSLLPKARFIGGSEPKINRSFTLQFASMNDDIYVHPTLNTRKVPFSSWMEVWNIYLSIRIDHTPAKAAEFIAYQCIITSASTQYPTAALDQLRCPVPHALHPQTLAYIGTSTTLTCGSST